MTEPAAPAKTRVFLVGAPRSGTTLLQSLLAAHPAVISFPETHFFPGIAPRPWWRPLPVVAARAPARWARVRETFAAVDESFGDPPKGRSKRAWMNAFFAELDAIADRHNAACWVEKTPNHLSYASMIRRYDPAVHFIHIMREGQSVVASLKEVTQKYPDQWGGAWPVEKCVEVWNRFMRHHRRWRGKPGHSFVRYEELAADPSAIMTPLMGTLGLEWSDDLVDKAGDAAKALQVNEAWKAGNTQGVKGPAQSKFDTVLTDTERAFVDQHLAQPAW